MAQQTTMRDDVIRVVKAFRQYACGLGWTHDDYQLWIYAVPEWGQIHTILVARESPPGNDSFEWWKSVLDSLEASLGDDPDLLDSIGLVVQTFDRVKQGGLGAIPSSYLDADELVRAITLQTI